MQYQLPVVDDTLVWDAWLALYKVPAISVALELEIFESLDAMPASAGELAERRGFNERGLKALLPMLKQLGFLMQHGAVYQLSEAGRHYMLKSSAFYWGGVFTRLAPTIVAHKLLLETVNNERENAAKNRPADGWESGHVDMEMARQVTAFMHSHSVPAAVGMTHTCDFSGVRRVLDVGGGSGCFSIALARRYPTISCTIMELPTICTLAQQYVADAGVDAQIDTVTVDMFRQDWPKGYDAHFFSNIFHDWSIETCVELAKKSYAALAPGGCILLHEMLLDDNGTEPGPAVAFSLLMAMGTKGQQFTFAQLAEILQAAGFIDITWQQSYGYYSLVKAGK
ncbi:MAG: methyltransferase [Pseudomonadota bacterium]